MRLTVLALAAAAFVLSACDYETKQAEAKCELDARKAASAAPGSEIDISQLVGLCMKASGFAVKTAPRCYDQHNRRPINLLDGACYERTSITSN